METTAPSEASDSVPASTSGEGFPPDVREEEVQPTEEANEKGCITEADNAISESTGLQFITGEEEMSRSNPIDMSSEEARQLLSGSDMFAMEICSIMNHKDMATMLSLQHVM